MKRLQEIERFYLLLFSVIFVSSQLFLNFFAITFIERLLVRQRLEQNEQLVRMAVDAAKGFPSRSDGGALREFLQELALKTYFNRESFVCAIDSNGYIIAHPDPARIGLYRGGEQIETQAGPRPFTGQPDLVEGIWNNQAFSSVEIVSTLFDEQLDITIAAHQNKALVDRTLGSVRLYFILFSVPVLAAFFAAVGC